VRHEFDVVMAWSVDRLGRSMPDLVAFLGEVNSAGVNLYLHQQGLDTSTAAGRAMFQMLGIFSEFERAMIVERTKAGLARARTHGTKSGKAIGRPSLPQDKVVAVRAALAAGMGIRAAARHLGLGLGTVHRLAKASAAA
jgi:DNA invertase Pin-like site-specific DNA recombinase